MMKFGAFFTFSDRLEGVNPDKPRYVFSGYQQATNFTVDKDEGELLMRLIDQRRNK